ncbi:aminopeptidase [Nitrosovibrio tenuis]|uniref:Predicted aminopeptidase n=1 Tax=Nitrosovibrio tenuis TaxID=1233 RepID=A0A1H7MBI7_9PROT|nr:aminopeptidase [Nitrosovibrio tenuis]SEL08700.1 Predicted aminopeptidase [Nitrosovibrio tenuis]
MITRILHAPRLAAVGFIVWLGGCANLGYYAQAVDGHMNIQNRVRPIHSIIADPEADPGLKRTLTLVARLREFASRELKLPDNQSFTTYADLGRRYAIWNVSAAPELSIEPEKWCFVAAGCVSYRGFFSEAEAQRFAEELRAKGYDVSVGGVRTYSTLGWFKDPILNTFLGYSDAELAQLIFHELAHQMVYVQDDSTFNESFATAVELEGIARWLGQHGAEDQRAAFDASQKRKAASTAIMLDYRKRLEELYASSQSLAEKRVGKARILGELREKLSSLETDKARSASYDKWLTLHLNNAFLASVSTYTHWVPAFHALLARHEGDIGQFYETVRELSRLPKAERTTLLHSTDGRTLSASNTDPQE